MASTLNIGFSTIDGYGLFYLPSVPLTLAVQNKGKKAKQTMKLVVLLPYPYRSHHVLIPDFPQPSGEHATVKWITVGGRTSAYVVEVQKPFLKQKIRDELPEVLSSITLIDKLE